MQRDDSVHVPARKIATLSATLSIAAVLIASIATAFALCGHFVKPHIDFFDFYEAASAFQRGELASTLKRAPVYPAVLAIGGAATGLAATTERPAMQVFGEWLNAALLPVNAMLVWLLARRWLVALGGDGRLAVIAAIWFCVLPWGMYCTAHLLLEPLLVTAILATVLLAGNRRVWAAYACAAVAIMVRYDVAGLVGGLVLADVLARRGVARTAMWGVAAIGPLAVWLVLTAVLWTPGDADHYVAQMRDHVAFDPMWACRIVLDVCFGPTRVALPAWVNLDEALVRGALRGALAVAFFIGACGVARASNIARSALATAGGAIGYLAVHSVFPFQWERFGYPLAPLMLVVAACGVQVVAAWVRARISRPARRLAIGTMGSLVAVLLVGEWTALPIHGMSASWRLILCGATVGLALAAAGALVAKPRRVGMAILAMLSLAIGAAHIRDGVATLGRGDEARHIVELAQWLARNTTAADVTISPIDSVLRLYADDAGGRFVPYSAIAAEQWTEIVAEFRTRGVRYVTWYDGVYAEHAEPRYRERWRLERFAVLDGGGGVAGLVLVWRSPQPPHAYVWEVQAVTTKPVAPEKAGGWFKSPFTP